MPTQAGPVKDTTIKITKKTRKKRAKKQAKKRNGAKKAKLGSKLLPEKRGEPSDIHYEVAIKYKEQGFDMDVLKPQTVKFNEQNIAGASSQKTYQSKTNQFWDFLTLIGQ